MVRLGCVMGAIPLGLFSMSVKVSVSSALVQVSLPMFLIWVFSAELLPWRMTVGAMAIWVMIMRGVGGIASQVVQLTQYWSELHPAAWPLT